ncbi:hypothetical protein IKJ53_04280 [bacterium]|nr:hypothetical protein [bacterium]
MMKVLIPHNKEFEYLRCKKMYEKYQTRVKDESTFDEVLQNTFFYSFYDGNVLTLCVYFYFLDGKLWVNGFGIRNKHIFNKECFVTSLGWFNCDIWAKTKYPEVKWALLRCGFKKYDESIYVFHQDKL